MSKTLNLADRLLSLGRRYHSLGREYDAFHTLKRLSGLAELPAKVAEETQVTLAEILLRRQKFGRARRHLAAALQHQPENARYHFLMATAANGGDQAKPERAAKHYRRSLELDAKQPECLSEYGLLSLRLDRVQEGIRSLRKAVELAPDDPHIVGRLAQGLSEVGQVAEARRILRIALFRTGGDQRFRQLYNDFQFQELRHEQQARLRGYQTEADNPEPVILPFIRPTPPRRPARSNKRVRRDGPTRPQSPHLPCDPSRVEKRHAQ